MDTTELKERLEAHKRWMDGKFRVEQLNLSGQDLRGIDLQGADLRRADFRGADLSKANLQCANLQFANLQGANLREANFHGADLRWAFLCETNLQVADLRWASLEQADLFGAKLEGTRLNNANVHNVKASEPIWTFSVGRDIAIATKKVLYIGCESHPWDVWLRDFEKIVGMYGYKKEEISNYIAVVKVMHDLIQKEN